MEQYNIIVSEHNIDNSLQGFELMQKPSSNVDYYGTNGTNVFIQFKDGTTYIYENVPKETIEEMKLADSIGSFVYKKLARKFEFKKFQLKMVNAKPR